MSDTLLLSRLALLAGGTLVLFSQDAGKLPAAC